MSENVESRYRQYRVKLDDGGIIQLTEPIEQHKTCRLYLGYWSDDKEVQCNVCRQTRTRGHAVVDAIRDWTCDEHDFHVCLCCVPVALNTKVEEHRGTTVME